MFAVYVHDDKLILVDRCYFDISLRFIVSFIQVKKIVLIGLFFMSLWLQVVVSVWWKDCDKNRETTEKTKHIFYLDSVPSTLL